MASNRNRQRVGSNQPPGTAHLLTQERDHLADRLAQGWVQIEAARQERDPRLARWEDAWLGLLAEYVYLCDAQSLAELAAA